MGNQARWRVLLDKVGEDEGESDKRDASTKTSQKEEIAIRQCTATLA